ncbi:MAG: hypothetical protein ACQETQ_02070 [Spirochaetota bacterium]
MTNTRRKKHYKVKGIAGLETYVWVLAEETEGYRILLRTYSQDNVKESEEFISFHLFDACVRTGYLSETQEPVLA